MYFLKYYLPEGFFCFCGEAAIVSGESHNQDHGEQKKKTFWSWQLQVALLCVQILNLVTDWSSCLVPDLSK